MGGERIARRRSSVLGRRVWGRPIDVERPHKTKSVMPELIRAPWADSSSVPVESIDLSSTGNLLATGSRDRQVRICKFCYSPEFSLASIC